MPVGFHPERSGGCWREAKALAPWVLLFGSVGLAFGEPEPYHIDAWGANEGLPQSSVTSICQRRNGYLWLGTFGGLARFDGVRFTIFDTGSTPPLPSERILSVFEDRGETMWLGTEEGRLARWAGSRLEVFTLPNRGTASKYVRAFAETTDGSLWMLSAEGQLLRFADGRFSVPSTNWPLAGLTANSLATDSSGHLWLGTDKELAVWQEGNFTPIWGQSREPGFTVDGLASSHSGGVWVAAHGKMRRFEAGDWKQDYGAYPWSKGVLLSMLEDRQGSVWLGTYGSGLFVYRTNANLIHLPREAGLPGNFIRSLYEDREGNMWAGTEGYGLVRLKRPVFRSYGRDSGLSSDLVLTVCEGHEGELWIGTNGEGVNRLQDGRVRHYSAESGLSNECVWSIWEDHRKTLWAGTWGGGLFRLQDDRFVPFGQSELCGPIVYGLYEDSRSSLWLGQPRNVSGISFISEGRLASLALPSRYPGLDVRVVTEDRAGNIWIGTHGDGLYRLREGQCSRFGTQNGLSSESIVSLYPDAEGVLWVGTGGGLNRLEGTRITSFTVRNGLPSNLICFITEDSLGNLWCGSGRGVFRVSKGQLNRPTQGQNTELLCYAYTQADGLPSLECSNGSQPAGCKTRDGRIWFPTVHGLAVVDPQDVPVNLRPPPVVIEELVVEGKVPETFLMPVAVAPGTGPEPLFRIPAGRPRFEIHYTGLSFTAPEKVRFKYKLDNLEENWVEAGSRRVAPYSYVRPGHYRFQVLACNNDGVWNEQGATVRLLLLPQFWQTWWFRLLGITALALLLIGAYELRLSSERRVTRLRLRIARDLHDEVGSNLGSIALLSEVIARPSPRTGSEEVSEIRRIAVQTIDALRDIVWLLDPAGDSPAELVLRMKDSARNLLAGIPFEFNSTGETGSARLPLELRRNIFPAFKEILHNVARHAHASHVEISVAFTPRQFELRVTDNGVGFEESVVRGGNGLKNLRRRAVDLAGTVHIQSRPGEGTTLRLTAPLT